MTKLIISTFKETPKTKIGWSAFILSLVAIFSGPILGISAALIVPSLDNAMGERIGQIFGFSLMIVMFGVLVAMLVCSIKAFRAGERSWAVMLSLVFSVLSVLFWLFMLVGELLFPH